MAKSKYRKNCKKCGAEYVDFGFGADKYCRVCGNELPKAKQPKRCSDCKNTISTKDKFCSGCGKELSKKTIKK